MQFHHKKRFFNYWTCVNFYPRHFGEGLELSNLQKSSYYKKSSFPLGEG